MRFCNIANKCSLQHCNAFEVQICCNSFQLQLNSSFDIVISELLEGQQSKSSFIQLKLGTFNDSIITKLWIHVQSYLWMIDETKRSQKLTISEWCSIFPPTSNRFIIQVNSCHFDSLFPWKWMERKRTRWKPTVLFHLSFSPYLIQSGFFPIRALLLWTFPPFYSSSRLVATNYFACECWCDVNDTVYTDDGGAFASTIVRRVEIVCVRGDSLLCAKSQRNFNIQLNQHT